MNFLFALVGATVTSSWNFSVSAWEVSEIWGVLTNLWGSFFTTFMNFFPYLLVIGGVFLVIKFLTNILGGHHKG